MKITRQQLLGIMPYAATRVSTYLPHLNDTIKEFGIDTPLRVVYFLATIAVESGEMRYTKEIASGSEYEGRRDLGNTHPLDGIRYKGRGFLQLTGRNNYAAYSEYCGVDLLKQPQLLEKPKGAVRSAGWFWWKHGLNRWADADSPKMVRKRVNGGLNGYKEFLRYVERGKKVFLS
jgi:putative chitinase